MKPPQIMRDFSYQAVANYLQTALQMVRGLILAGLLGPAGLGTFSTVGIVLAWSQYADLGLGGGVAREIPLARGAGRENDAERWRWYALLFRIVAETIAGLALAVVLLSGIASWGADLTFGLATASLVVILQGVVVVYLTTLSAWQRFDRAAWLITVQSVMLLVLCVAGGWLWGVRGVFVGQLFSFAVTCAFAVAVGGVPRPVALRRSELRHLLAVGFPLAVLNFVGYNLIYVDQVMVLALLGRSALGVYMLALYGGAALCLLPAAVASVVGPRLIRRFGEEASVDGIARHTWQPVRVLSLALPPAIIALWLLGPLVIEAFLPEYGPGIAPLRIYSVGVFFLGLNLGVSTTLLALNKHRYNIPILISVIGVNVVLDLLLVGILDWGLPGIALGSAVTYFVYWMTHTALVRWYFGQRPLTAMARNLVSGWPGLALAAVAALSWAAGTLVRSDLRWELPVALVVVAVTGLRWRLGGVDAERAR